MRRALRLCAASMLILAVSALGPGDLLAEQEPQTVAPPAPSFRMNELFPDGAHRVPVRKAADLPAPFQEAAAQTRCDLGNLAYVKGELVRVSLGTRDHVFAVLPCAFGPVGSDSLYGLRDRSRAYRVFLPVLGRSGGFGSTEFPGHLKWEPETASLTALRGTDMLPHNQLRYRYKLANEGVAAPLSGPLVLVRVEIRPMSSARERDDDTDWRVLWEATPWDVDLPR